MNPIQQRDPSLRDVLRVFHRRRMAIIATLAVSMLTAIVACIATTREYQAKGVIQLQKSSADSLNLDTLMGAAGGGGAGDSLSANVDLQTQSNILQSSTLALKVISELQLEEKKQYQPRFSLFGWAIGFLSAAGPQDPISATLAKSPNRRDRLLRVFSDNLKVRVTPGTRLIEVNYDDPDPQVAADVVNHLFQGLIDYTFQTKFNATNEASRWLEDQLGDLRGQSESLQAKVVALQKSTGLFGIGGVDLQGKPVIFSPTLDRLQASTTALSQAELNRILKGSIYEVARTGNADLISQLSGTSVATGASQGVTNSLSLIESLRSQEASVGAQVAKDAATFGPQYPALIEERASLAHLRDSLQAEIARVAQRAKNDYDIAVTNSEGARASFNNDKEAAEKLNDRTIEYTILAKEADQSQGLYQDLLRRLKEAGILEGLRSSNITIVDPALAPSKPSKPRIAVYLGLGFAVGFVLGFCVAMLIDSIDNKVQDTSDIDAMELPRLGIAPVREGSAKDGSMPIDPSNSSYSEAVRRLRSSLLISRSGAPPQVILVTSGSEGEGKSTISLNLAASFAQFNKKVLLIEADLRRPVMRKRLALPGYTGLSSLLSSAETPFEPHVLDERPNLFLLPAGPRPPFPSELLGSDRLVSLLQSWRQQFDFIVIDSPPILPVTDAEVLEDHVDATLLIARAGITSRIALQRSYSLIMPHAEHKGAANVGIVLNAVKLSSAAYYGYYGNYGSRYSNYYMGGDTDEAS